MVNSLLTPKHRYTFLYASCDEYCTVEIKIFSFWQISSFFTSYDYMHMTSNKKQQ